MPLVAPGPVQIREVPVVDEPLDETEVRTLIAAPLPSSAARPPRRAPLLEQEDVVEDSVTTQAPYALAVRWLSEDDAERVSDSAVAAAPVANWTPSTARSAVDDVYEEERTTRGPRRNLEDLAVMAAAASEHPSITTEGPSTIADILRSTGSAPPNLASPEPIENQTAVMVNAPARPPSTHSGMAYGVSAEGGRPAADFMESSSGASMRVPVLRSDAGQGVNPGSDDLSLVTGRRAPRYGLMVALVALFSIAIPVALFVGLQDRANRRLGRAPSEPTSDVVSRDGVPRAKATRPAPSASPSATAVRPSWFPRRR